MDVIGLREEEAEEILQRQGCRVIQRVVTEPPQRRGEAGRRRVVRQRCLTSQDVEITLTHEMVLDFCEVSKSP